MKEPALVMGGWGAAYSKAEALAGSAIRESTLESELAQRGLRFPSAEDLSDSELSNVLWQLIRSLAGLRVFLHSTDHLGERELYTRLRDRELPMETLMPEPGIDEALHIDMLGSGEDEAEDFLRFYADDMEREQWRQDWPDMCIPDRKPLPFDRDRLLPRRGEFHGGVMAGSEVSEMCQGR